MKTTSFTPFLDLIIVEARIWGPHGHKALDLAVDTGSSHTVILPRVLDELGFNPRDGLVITGVYSAVGKEQGYLIKGAALLGPRLHPHRFPIHVFDLADHYGIDGLLGLSFLHRYDYTVRSAAGQILVEETAPALT
jgi:predicted aspartyl protease